MICCVIDNDLNPELEHSSFVWFSAEFAPCKSAIKYGWISTSPRWTGEMSTVLILDTVLTNLLMVDQ